jgi:ferredoxin, 2Fe-2S
MPKMFVTDRDGGQHEFELQSGQSIFEPLREIDTGIEALCGGMCSCATCHVYIASEWAGKLPLPQDDELELLEETECFREGESRLACQVAMADELDGMSLIIAPEE